MKRINISSRAKPGQDLGDFDGTIENITSEPHIIKLPLAINIRGDIQKINLKDLNIKALMNYTNPQKPNESIKISLGSFPVSSLNLVSSDDYLISIAKAIGNTQIDLNLQEDNINFNFNQNFLTPVWSMVLRKTKQSKNLETVGSLENVGTVGNLENVGTVGNLENVGTVGNLEALLEEIKKAQQDLFVRANITGTIQSPNIGLSSNLGRIVKNALEKQITSRVKENLTKGQDKINELIQSKLGPYSKEIDLLQLDLNKGDDNLKGLTDKFEKEIKDITSKKGKEKINKLKDKIFKKLKL